MTRTLYEEQYELAATLSGEQMLDYLTAVCNDEELTIQQWLDNLKKQTIKTQGDMA